MNPEIVQLTTCRHSSEVLTSSHPRPQLRRGKVWILNGCWDFKAASFSGTIRVPFPTESALSGVEKHFDEGTLLRYSLRLPEIPRNEGDIVLLHLDAVDQEADIFINDVFVSKIHTIEGRRGIDITSFLSEENTLAVCVTDDISRKQYPYGKQTLKRGGMWYTPFSGIWQNVWIEVVPENYIRSLKIRTSLTEAVIEIDGPENGVVLFEGEEVPYESGELTLCPKHPVCWTPDNPKLYDFTVRAGSDEVHSYFALRTLSVQKENGISRLCLNEKPFFFHGLLDQGYWPDGICTPPDPSCFAEDILAMKELGFNTLRKHIKLEHEQFYYDCDRLGMIVFQDMVNNGPYSFFRDTLLPTIGIKRLNDRSLNPDPKNRQMFLEMMERTVAALFNHPSICCWTIFNEGWGQFNAAQAYDCLKAMDSSRFIDTASGWFLPEKSDVLSLHVYFKAFRMTFSEKPVLLSEFGGYSCKIPGHSFNKTKTYGYRFFKDPSIFMDALEKLYLEEILPAVMQGLSGAIYTQVSDVEDETNGLLTYDRAVCKTDKKRMQKIARQLRSAVSSLLALSDNI